MQIKAYTLKNHKDFRADYVCEMCGYTFNGWGINDLFFFDTVMPSCVCPNCKRNSYGEDEIQVIKRCGKKYVL